MAAFAPPEIETADLAPLALELANWGAEAGDLAFLTAPPEGALAEARELLSLLGALEGGAVTAHGRQLAAAPTHPRLAHMILTAPAGAARTACNIAALLEDRDPMRSAGADIAQRLRVLAGARAPDGAAGAMARIRAEATRLARRMGVGSSADARSHDKSHDGPSPAADGADAGALIARAYPDRIALRRPGGEARYLLSGGKGARLAPEDDLASQRLLAVADSDGADGREAVIRLAAPLGMTDLEALYSARMIWREVCEWSRRDRRVIARRQRMLGALALEDKTWPDAPPEALAAAMAMGLRDLGIAALPWTAAARRAQARAVWARQGESGGTPALPDLSDEGLLAGLDDWLVPYLTGMTSAADLSRFDMVSLLRDALGWEGAQIVDRAAPSHFTAPTGTKVPIDYSGAAPSAAIRLQELFGLDVHPMAAGVPLVLELLSPASRPVQTTADLPGFWRSSYADVRKDMRGRYPRHPWPEDPVTAAPTTRVKPRGT